MRIIITFLSLFTMLAASANERVSIAKSFEGSYELALELTNDTKEPCLPDLEVVFWANDKFLDLQFLSPLEGIVFVNIPPSEREYLENSQVFDVINKVNISEDEKYKTTTRITNHRIEEKTLKGKPDNYDDFRYQANLSRNPFNGQVRFESIDRKKKRKVCLYE